MWRLAAAVLAAMPVSAVLWFESVYLWFGLSGADLPGSQQAIVALGSWAAVVAWSLRGTARAAGVVLRAARLGIAASIALPVVAVGVLLLWEASEGRRDLGMGGMMPGMLTPEEMSRLAAAKGQEFDRLFLEGMIRHHDGALTMVNELFAQPGAGQESEMFAFASDVDADQRMEIVRMSALLKELQK